MNALLALLSWPGAVALLTAFVLGACAGHAEARITRPRKGA